MLQRARLKLMMGKAINISGGISGPSTEGDRNPWISIIHGETQQRRMISDQHRQQQAFDAIPLRMFPGQDYR